MHGRNNISNTPTSRQQQIQKTRGQNVARTNLDYFNGFTMIEIITHLVAVILETTKCCRWQTEFMKFMHRMYFENADWSLEVTNEFEINGHMSRTTKWIYFERTKRERERERGIVSYTLI